GQWVAGAEDVGARTGVEDVHRVDPVDSLQVDLGGVDKCRIGVVPDRYLRQRGTDVGDHVSQEVDGLADLEDAPAHLPTRIGGGRGRTGGEEADGRRVRIGAEIGGDRGPGGTHGEEGEHGQQARGQ